MSTVGITAENGAPANGPKESDPSGDDKELTSKSAMPASREEREDARPISKDVAHSNAAAIEHPPEDEEDALKRVLKESEQEARLDKVARARV